jgi:aminomethyltransferase
MGAELQKTSLHELHLSLGARMGAFAGWEMPLSYAGTRAEHRAVRARAGVFDVSHMGQIEIRGQDAAEFLQRMLTNDISRISPGEGQYTLMLDTTGGVIDDLIAYDRGDDYLLVVNASNTHACRDWLTHHAPDGVAVDDRSIETAMIALQGVDWKRLLGGIGASEGTLGLEYFHFTHDALAGTGAMVARTGYTGEPGVELLVPWGEGPALWSALMAVDDPPEPAGLVARDTLRLEMGYPLHGNDIGPDRTPLEAGLGWACDLDSEFTAVDVLRARREEGLDERLCAFVLTERGIPRRGQDVLVDGEVCGRVTSGSLSPTLDVGIGLAYVPPEVAEAGTKIAIDVRGSVKGAEVRRPPLVDTSPKKG